MMPAMDRRNMNRSIGRRKEDNVVREKLYRNKQLFNVGQILTSEIDINTAFKVIMDQTNEIMSTERSTVFLHDEKAQQLWSLVATDMEENEIRIPADQGLAGWVFQHKTPVVINDPYNDPRFYSKVDMKSGFRTRNILCIPLINRKGECIGSFQALNKKSGDFIDEDLDLLASLSHYVAIALENSNLYKEVKDYSERLRKTLLRIEMLERIKTQLTKFVPSSVAKLAEKDPEKLAVEKIPMHVTVLFIDIQGFSKITEEFDQMLVNDMVESHFSAYLDSIRRYGGEVNETSGDGLMIIFKDESPEKNNNNAVTAAMEIILENRRLNKEFQYPWGRVDLHLGINSGKAWVGSTKMKSLSGERWTYTASGLVTVLAARIGALSHETRLYIGPETHKCLDDSYDCEFIGLHGLKNIKNPIPVYQVKDIIGNSRAGHDLTN